MAEYANPDALVETDWLAEHLDDPGIRIVDVDKDTSAYEKGHVPGVLRRELDRVRIAGRRSGGALRRKGESHG